MGIPARRTGGIGTAVKVTHANNGGTYTYSYTDLLPSAVNIINGLFGVFDLTDKIQEVEFYWNRDLAGVDNIYFSTTISSVLNGGPTAVNFSDKDTIPLPSETGSAIPEPTTLMLLGLG